jgi:formylmethanofuran dehydrogenase subunit E
MAKGFLKYMMLKAISENEATGYQLIKKVASVTGHKPSTGSIYPLLKSMEKDGWISGKSRDDKTIYKITKLGREKIKEFDEIKMDQIFKIHESIIMANETFSDTGHLAVISHTEMMEVLEPIIIETGRLLQNGVPPEKIIKIIKKTAKELKVINGK